MFCSHITKHDFEEIKRLSLAHKIAPDKQEELIRLPRGGIIIQTSVGNIQFGMPPETVKDSMLKGLDVPRIFVLPTKRFDFNACLNVAEFEFPAYFNFFVRQKRVTLVCTKEAKESIEIVFQETLLGPSNFDGIDEEFDPKIDKEARPNFYKEIEYFARDPTKKGAYFTVGTLIEFIVFDENNRARINDDVEIHKGDQTFQIIEKGKPVAIVPDQVEITEVLPPVNPLSEVKDEMKDHNQLASSVEEIQDLQGGLSCTDLNPIHFVPPTFGVTVLGNSHGFDPKGCTSGYIIWVNGRGVLVDPPPFAIQKLKRLGITNRLIETVIISHCHGDHDAGVFQKVLDTFQVEIITTKTIMNSFIKKYSALLNLSPEKISSLFRFKPVTIGASLYVNGAVFKFFYALHSIPAIGFEVFCSEKSLYFSSDTFYEPEKLAELVKEGVLTKKRYDSLCGNIWNHDLVLHEAGVPPIHTPMRVLKALPNDVKQRTYLVHVAAKDVPADSGLKIAPLGLENTIMLDPTPIDPLNIVNILDVVCSIEIFRNVLIRTMKDAIISADKQSFKPGETIVEEGQVADKFYIIIDGIVRMWSGGMGEGAGFERYYQMGDFFGESLLRNAGKRAATAIAITETRILVIPKSDFLFFFGENKDVCTKLNNLIDIRPFSVLKSIRKNSLFSSISSSQKLQLEYILHYREVKANETIWKKGDVPEFAVLICKGMMEVTYDSADFKEDEDNTDEFSEGVFICETKAMLEGLKCKMSLIAVSDCQLFSIQKGDYLRFLENNPKLYINLSLNDIVEQGNF